MDMPVVTDAHKKLNVFAGKWQGEEKMFPSPWDPKGGTAIGRSDTRIALDGFALVHDYEQERGGAITFRGHGILRYDAPTNRHQFHWFDSMGSPPELFEGGEKDGVWTFTSKNPIGYARCSFDFRTSGQYRFKMEMSEDGSTWAPMMDGVMKRV